MGGATDPVQPVPVVGPGLGDGHRGIDAGDPLGRDGRADGAVCPGLVSTR